MEKEVLIQKIATILSDMKCKNILSIDVSKKTDVTEAFVICSAKNPPQAKAAYEEICAKLEAEGIYTAGVDGLREGRWIVMDYGNVIVHIFHTSQRDLYQFEKLWGSEDGSNITHFDQE
ncbi:MAG TPA: ribosome silencing factor [Clostridiales bacterium]|nr:ribosome silencing factor [Clostridiales bacterium]